MESGAGHARVHLNGHVGAWAPRQPQWQHWGRPRFWGAPSAAEWEEAGADASCGLCARAAAVRNAWASERAAVVCMVGGVGECECECEVQDAKDVRGCLDGEDTRGRARRWRLGEERTRFYVR